MVSFAMCVLAASALAMLAQPSRGDQPLNGAGVKILATISGKDKIKDFIAHNPQIPYQFLGKDSPDFPHSQFGQPGFLKVIAIIRGREPIATFVKNANLPVQVPQNLLQSMSASGPAPSNSKNPLHGQRQPQLPAWTADGQEEPPLPPWESMTYEEQLEEWNSGAGRRPPDAWSQPAKTPTGPAPSNSKNPLSQKRKEPPAVKPMSYEDELALWMTGIGKMPSHFPPALDAKKPTDLPSAPHNNQDAVLKQKPSDLEKKPSESDVKDCDSNPSATPACRYKKKAPEESKPSNEKPSDWDKKDCDSNPSATPACKKKASEESTTSNEKQKTSEKPPEPTEKPPENPSKPLENPSKPPENPSKPPEKQSEPSEKPAEEPPKPSKQPPRRRRKMAEQDAGQVVYSDF